MDKETIQIYDYDANYIYVECTDEGFLSYLSDSFTFQIPHYKAQHTKAYQNGTWDGKIRFFNKRKSLLHRGFLSDMVRLIRESKILKCTYIDEQLYPEIKKNTEMGKDLIAYIKQEIMPMLAEDIEMRKYQARAFVEAIKNLRKLIICPTSSGKTFIMYMILRFYIDCVLEEDEKVLIIVPSLSLIQQTYKELSNVYDVDGFLMNNIHCIYEGQKKNSKKKIYLSTHQSIAKLKPDYFEKFRLVMVDEVHHLNDDSDNIRNILLKCVNAIFRVGLTGSLSNIETAKMTARAFFGKIYKVISTKELERQGHISKSKIYVVNMKYNNYKKTVMNVKSENNYMKEIAFISEFEPRNKKIIDIISKRKGNKLLLFNRVKHGKQLKKFIEEKGINYHFIDGKTSGEKREEIRLKMEEEDDTILLASWQCVATGFSVKKLHYVAFCSTFKAQIKNIQAIGRGLRKHPNKDKVIILDFVDDMRLKGNKKGMRLRNFLYKHSLVRQELYFKEEFEYIQKELEL